MTDDELKGMWTAGEKYLEELKLKSMTPMTPTVSEALKGVPNPDPPSALSRAAAKQILGIMKLAVTNEAAQFEIAWLLDEVFMNDSKKGPGSTDSGERICIGESEFAGMPLSAPVVYLEKPMDHPGVMFFSPSIYLRWIKKDGYFALQQCHFNDKDRVWRWQDVPCVIP